MPEIAIASWARYIGANEEIQKQFFSSGRVSPKVFSIGVGFGGDCGSTRRGGHYGGGQGYPAQIATS